MSISYSRGFKKMFKKLPARQQDQFEERLTFLIENPYHPFLHNHPLAGPWLGFRSINVAGDLRAVYEELINGEIEFVAIGSHSELYS